MDVGGRRKAFFGGYLAKYMFIKKCRAMQVDPLVAFLGIVGKMYKKKFVGIANDSGTDEMTSGEECDSDDVV